MLEYNHPDKLKSLNQTVKTYLWCLTELPCVQLVFPWHWSQQHACRQQTRQNCMVYIATITKKLEPTTCRGPRDTVEDGWCLAVCWCWFWEVKVFRKKSHKTVWRPYRGTFSRSSEWDAERMIWNTTISFILKNPPARGAQLVWLRNSSGFFSQENCP